MKRGWPENQRSGAGIEPAGCQIEGTLRFDDHPQYACVGNTGKPVVRTALGYKPEVSHHLDGVPWNGRTAGAIRAVL